MQDRFRFRFWDKEAKTMQKFPKIELNYKVTLDKIVADDRVIFMQCTGLRDKNGKLIYERDILRQPDGIIDYVLWVDGCYIHNGIAITNYDVAYQGDTWAKEVNTHEVIGNIYENPELLEV